MAAVVKSRGAKLFAIAGLVLLPLALQVSPAHALVNPTITSSATQFATVGQPISDSATFSGTAGTPTGMAQFKAYLNDATCTSATALKFTSSIATLSGGTAASGNFTPTAAGTYTWSVLYGGDANYNSFQTCGGTNESSQVFLPNPTITSSATPTVQVNTTPISDSATFTGTNGAVTGQAQFKAYLNDATCTSATALKFTSAIQTISGGSASTTGFVPTAVGSYTWAVLYSGSSNYNSFQTCGGTNETSTVTPAPSSTFTLPNTANAVINTPVNDSAVVSGDTTNGAPTGSVNFFVCGPLPSASGCPSGGTSVGSGPLTTLNSSQSTASSPAFTPTADGTYCFRAEYPATGNYQASSDSSSHECFGVFDQIFTGNIPGGLVVPAGQNVLIQDAHIGGGVSANGAASVKMCNSTTGGTVAITRTTGPVIVGDPANGCFANTIGGSLSLTNNLSSVVAKNNTVAGAVVASGNASQDISGNHH